MVLIPFYMAYLGKTGYSNIVMILGLFSVLSFVLALNAGVFFYYYEWEKKKFQKMIFTSWFYYQIVCTAIIALSLFFFADSIKNLFIVTADNEQEITTAISITGLLFIPYLFNITNINYFRIDRKARSVIVIVFLEALFTMSFVVVGLKYFDFGLVEVVLAQVAARVLVALLYIKTAKNYIYWKNISLKILKRLLAFSWPYFLLSLGLFCFGFCLAFFCLRPFEFRHHRRTRRPLRELEVRCDPSRRLHTCSRRRSVR